jgi:hypothetical protein
MSQIVSFAVDPSASAARRIGAALAALLLTTHAFAAADALPASVRSCAAETDPDRRLACFDREVARFPAPTAKAAARSAPVETAPAGETSPPSTANIAMANTATPPVETPQQQPSARKDSQQRVSAHIVSLKRSPSEMLLTLDNGQVWQQTQAVAGDMSLREGDTVTIDKHFGSYWLAGPHVSSMKVQQQTSPPAAAAH